MATGLFYFIFLFISVNLLFFFLIDPVMSTKKVKKELSQKSENNTLKSHAAVIVGSIKYMIVDF